MSYRMYKYAERVVFRDTKNMNNLVLFIESYHSIGNFAKALPVLDFGLGVKPDSYRSKKLKQEFRK